MPAAPLSQTKISIIDGYASEQVLPELNNLNAELAFARVVEHLTASSKAQFVAGYSVKHIKDDGASQTICFYFAQCAADVLRPQAAKELIASLKNYPGENMFAREIHARGIALEDILKGSFFSEAFVLQNSNGDDLCTGIAKIETGDMVIDRKTGEVYFPFPDMPNNKSVPSAGSPAPAG